MFESIANFFRKLVKAEGKQVSSKDTAKERLHLVLMQDRANVSADFMELMKQEIIEVIKKYIEVEETAIDVRLTNEVGEDGVKGAPSLYANIPIINIKNDIKKNIQEDKKVEDIKEKTTEESKEEVEKIEKENKEDIEEVEDKKEEVQEDVASEEIIEENNEEKEIEGSTEVKEEKIEDEKSIEEEKPDKNNKEEDKEANTTEKEEK